MPSLASEGMDEAALVREALGHGVVRTRVAATRARGEAAGVAAPLLDNPVVEMGHDQANGPAGASTDSLGVTVTLGLGGGAEARAARLRGEAGGAWTHAAVVGAICGVRRDALDLWLATERAQVARASQGRLEALLAGLGRLATAGEVAGYEQGRLAMSVSAHGHAVDSAEAERWKARARLSAHMDRSVDSVALLEMADLDDRAAALDAALGTDPVLQALRGERGAAELALVAARRAALPKLALSGGARWDALPDGSSRTPGFEVGAGISLPLLDRNQPEVAARHAALADLDARLAARDATVRAAVDAAWQQASALGPMRAAPPTDAVWQGARERFTAGEAHIDELLTVVADLEAAEVAASEGEALRRAARLDLSCTAGAFPEPAIQALLEEQIR